MVLPLTLATFRGVLIEARTAFVRRADRAGRARDALQVGRHPDGGGSRDPGRQWTRRGTRQSRRRARSCPLPPRAVAPDEALPALILGAGEQRLAFAVDAILDEREVLVKRFEKPLSRVRNIAGATVLGSGEVAPILNVTDLLKSAKNAGAPIRSAAAARRRYRLPRNPCWWWKIPSPRACCSRESWNPPATA